nr:MAG TPA: hypothetical protein [Caudoviricetes sp.]
MKYYRNEKTKEMVSEIEAVEYELDDLGITITPKGKNGEFTQDQIVVMEELIFDWFYDSDWKTIYLEEDYGEEIY